MFAVPFFLRAGSCEHISKKLIKIYHPFNILFFETNIFFSKILIFAVEMAGHPRENRVVSNEIVLNVLNKKIEISGTIKSLNNY